MGATEGFMRAQIEQLEKENKKLKEDNRFLTKISKEYMEKENIIEISEFTELYRDDLEEENKKLKQLIKDFINNFENLNNTDETLETIESILTKEN